MKRDLTLLTDFYELTMANSYYNLGRGEEIAYFDYFFRNIPDNGGYAIFAVLEQPIDYIKILKYLKRNRILRSKNLFSDGFKFLKVLNLEEQFILLKKDIQFSQVEPIISVKGPIIDCQIIETVLLLTVNQSLIATKASE